MSAGAVTALAWRPSEPRHRSRNCKRSLASPPRTSSRQRSTRSRERVNGADHDRLRFALKEVVNGFADLVESDPHVARTHVGSKLLLAETALQVTLVAALGLDGPTPS